MTTRPSSENKNPSAAAAAAPGAPAPGAPAPQATAPPAPGAVAPRSGAQGAEVGAPLGAASASLAGSPSPTEPALRRMAGLPLTVRVTAGEGRITLGHVRSLAPGETLVLDRPGDGPLALDCNGVPLGEVEVESPADGGLTATLVRLEGSGDDAP